MIQRSASAFPAAKCIKSRRFRPPGFLLISPDKEKGTGKQTAEIILNVFFPSSSSRKTNTWTWFILKPDQAKSTRKIVLANNMRILKKLLLLRLNKANL